MNAVAALRDSFARRDEMSPDQRLIAVSAIGVSLLLLWAAIAPVDEITRGMGKVIPSSKVQVVQAADASVVREILVRQGQLVKQGQLLVRLDDSQSASQLGQLQAESERLEAKAARLQQEGTGGSSGNCTLGTPCVEEQALAQIRRETAASRQSALSAAVEQRRRDLQEGAATVSSLTSSVKLQQDQVNMLSPLAAKGIVPKTDLLNAQRELVDLQGKLSAAREGMGRANAAIAEAQAQLSSARLDFRQQALNERSEVATKLAVNEETIKGASARLERNELRAPVTGLVNDVKVTTVGGFVTPGEAVMQVVPVGDKLLVEARVSPKDIAFLKIGDRANVKVTAYDFSIYGGLPGKVRNISADSIYDEAEKQAYYTVVVETDRSYLVKNGRQLPIMPGMICDVEIITGSKSVLAYLLKPVLRAFDEALTER
ncbi:HlyD family type I secretion periplasmic adaptor subunit [Novosphingobium flavum]|uniref:Membrane fusion protein (MFP) family protein n=1 Tax=Novosphingobium flavum TaxID=1778672 RepID=A0A7X1FT06_9SPHN|nr:HlyD family type I secretion periplasmic adaptor subunit [Novosphingobium flavum]MBC2666309.1 HlyD family type I secretion periplasmic adaptor subunit [Novosphingobium flavum]